MELGRNVRPAHHGWIMGLNRTQSLTPRNSSFPSSTIPVIVLGENTQVEKKEGESFEDGGLGEEAVAEALRRSFDGFVEANLAEA